MIIPVTLAEEHFVSPDSPSEFAARLAALLGAEPSQLDWPAEFVLYPGDWSAVFDPHNALLTVYGVRAADFADPALAWCAAGRPEGEPVCSRLLAVTAETGADAWQALGFCHEGSLAGYWEGGAAAELWARMSGARAAQEQPAARPAGRPAAGLPELPAGWTCRPAQPADAADITGLVRRVFSDYPVPDDPGTVRFALASGSIHGRLIRDEHGVIQAYATLEFQPGEGAAEITDCATAPASRGRGLMRHLVAALQQDQSEVFGSSHVYALAREDQPAMQQVLAGLGWRRTGRLVHHFRLDERWVSAAVWVGTTF